MKWKEGQGYGFIKRNGETGQTFVHVSSFPVGQSHPKEGELVTYEMAVGAKGEHAINVQYVNRAKHVIKPTRFEKPKRNRNYFSLIVMMIFGFLILTLMSPKKSGLHEATVESSNPLPLSLTQQDHTFQCSGKSKCHEMTSCDEAIYYLKNCPGTLMDGDGDGLPCEDEWCGH